MLTRATRMPRSAMPSSRPGDHPNCMFRRDFFRGAVEKASIWNPAMTVRCVVTITCPAGRSSRRRPGFEPWLQPVLPPWQRNRNLIYRSRPVSHDVGMRIASDRPMEQESEVIELWPTAQTSSGIHLLIEWFGCAGAPTLLREVAALRSLCLAAAKEAGLPVLAELFRQRAEAGVTGIMLLAESHLTIHTWPAARSVAVDVFVGARARYNRAKAHAVHARLRDAMLPEKENFLSVNRGDRARAGALAPIDAASYSRPSSGNSDSASIHARFTGLTPGSVSNLTSFPSFTPTQRRLGPAPASADSRSGDSYSPAARSRRNARRFCARVAGCR